ARGPLMAQGRAMTERDARLAQRRTTAIAAVQEASYDSGPAGIESATEVIRRSFPGESIAATADAAESGWLLANARSGNTVFPALGLLVGYFAGGEALAVALGMLQPPATLSAARGLGCYLGDRELRVVRRQPPHA